MIETRWVWFIHWKVDNSKFGQERKKQWISGFQGLIYRHAHFLSFSLEDTWSYKFFASVPDLREEWLSIWRVVAFKLLSRYWYLLCRVTYHITYHITCVYFCLFHFCFTKNCSIFHSSVGYSLWEFFNLQIARLSFQILDSRCSRLDRLFHNYH